MEQSKESNSSNNQKNEPADFEKAIGECGFGLFNLILLLVSMLSCTASVFETSTMSYILPAAECDLKLSLYDKGILNAITYAGMITSALIWGFLGDTIGRKKCLVYGLLLDSMCAIACSLSQNTYTLMIFKYFGGFLACGPFAVLMSYLSEMHGVKYRAMVMMIIGIFFSIATVSLPLLSWGVLPQQWDFQVIEGLLEIHSWNVFLAICSLPSFISGFCIIFLPESPKFLMSKGRNQEALEVFQTIWFLNTRKKKSEFPIKLLVIEKQSSSIFNIEEQITNKSQKDKEHKSLREHIRAGFKQLRPLFQKPYLSYSILVYMLQFCILTGQNTIRLWLPQLFASIGSYELMQSSNNVTGSTNLCLMLDYGIYMTQQNLNLYHNMEQCKVIIPEAMYTNTIIVGLCGFGGYLVASSLIRKIGNKKIMIIGLTISGATAISLYWANSSRATVFLASACVTVGSISSTALLGVIVNLFPTSSRTMVVSIAMMCGRLGSLLGNLLFPYIMASSCIATFSFIGVVLFSAAGLSFFLPETHKNALK